MKPRATWMITALCLALLSGAMVWITRSMLRMEDEQNRMANEASVQEMARLALWSMETIAWELVVDESSRTPEQYRTFSTPVTLLDNKTLSTWDAGEVVELSQLLRAPPEYCKLHFEMDANGNVRSPQVPEGKDLMACQSANVLPEPVIQFNAANLIALCDRIDSNGSEQFREMREKLRAPKTLTGNRARLWSFNESPVPEEGQQGRAVTPAVTPAPSPAPAPAPETNPPANPSAAAQDKAEAFNTRAVQSPAFAQQRASRLEQSAQQQAEITSEDNRTRQVLLQNSMERAASRRDSNYENGLYKQSAGNNSTNLEAGKESDGNAGPLANETKDALVTTPGGSNAAPSAAKSAATRVAAPAAPSPPVVAKQPVLLPEAASVREVPVVRNPASGSAVSSAAPPLPAPAPSPATNAIPDITEFKALWLGDELLLTRRVTTSERQWIQGAWLDWEKLRVELLNAVKDRFPAARVVRAPEPPEPGAHRLASLPVQLIPGAVTFSPAPFWSPLKVSLSIAWLCVLLAIAAVALVLRGMVSLSERRASFVSSVTHELRTPLATFKIYSEMLADGMVKEEGKKQQYLETLTGEADRLGHLVENVLAYSRIERGKGPVAAASMRAADLVHRIEPRLNQRTLLAGMDFGMTADPGALEISLRTDAGAVEQILCNLVDNACKYGRREGAAGRVELVISRERRRLCLAVRDCGPGIPKGEQNTIFLPFHKSAREAAHSAPGVGLGLALCRRLACELGGTLEIDRSWKQGASFVLRLPV